MTAALLALAVLLPAWAWSPFVLDDPRLDGALLAAVAAALVAAVRPARLPRGAGLLFGALCLGLLPLLFAGEPPVWGGLADRAPLLAALALLAAAVARPAAVERALPWVVGGVFLTAGYGLLQRAGLDPLGWRPEPGSPPVAPLAGTNHATELLVLALVSVVAAPALAARGWWLAALPVALHAGWFGVTAFRLALPLGLAAAVRADRRRLLPAAMLLLAAVAGEGARAWTEESPPESAAKAPGPDLSSWEVRWLTHQDVLAKAVTTPLGIGLGRFELDFPHWRSPETLRVASRDYTDPATPTQKDPHDEPLLLLIECGWLGLLLGAGGLLLLLRRPDRAAWTSAPLLALAVPLLVRAPLSENPAALAFAALLLGAGARSSDGPAPTGTPRPAAALAAPALAFAALLAAPSQLLGELGVASYLEQPAGGAGLRRALEARPWDARAWDLLAADRGQRGRPLEEIREALVQALRHDPSDLFALTARFEVEVNAGDAAAALAALERAELLAPGHPAVTEKRRWIEQELPQQALEAMEAGDDATVLAALATAESFAPHHPGVAAARTAFLRLQAERQREAASEAFQRAADADFAAQDGARMRRHLLSAHLFEALVRAREGDPAACRESLEAAAVYADDKRSLVARTARRQDLDETLVRELLLRFDPEVGMLLGPAPASAETGPAEAE